MFRKPSLDRNSTVMVRPPTVSQPEKAAASTAMGNSAIAILRIEICICTSCHHSRFRSLGCGTRKPNRRHFFHLETISPVSWNRTEREVAAIQGGLAVKISLPFAVFGLHDTETLSTPAREPHRVRPQPDRHAIQWIHNYREQSNLEPKVREQGRTKKRCAFTVADRVVQGLWRHTSILVEGSTLEDGCRVLIETVRDLGLHKCQDCIGQRQAIELML